MDPNSQHQLWSEWTFDIFEGGKHVPFVELKPNAIKWLRKKFGSAGRVRFEEGPSGWKIIAQIEGVPAQDPNYVAAVKVQFANQFVLKGWGNLAKSRVDVRTLAGDMEDGSPPTQLVVMPTIGRI
jgi:hypothetical protein